MQDLECLDLIPTTLEVLSAIVNGNKEQTMESLNKMEQRFKKCEEALENLPGSELSLIEQKKKLKNLVESLETKRSIF